MQLSRETFREIVDLLIPFMGTMAERQALLQSALFGVPVLDGIDYGGDARATTTRIVAKLIEYGTAEPGKEALALVLEEIRGQVGLDKQQQIDVIFELLQKTEPAQPPEQEAPSGDQPATLITVEGDVGPGAVIGDGNVTARDIAGGSITHIENLVINVGSPDKIHDIERIVKEAPQQIADLGELLKPIEPAQLPAALSLPGEPRDFEPPWVLVPAGEFLMGSDPNDRQAFDNELPQHTANIAAPFLIARTPVTNAQYKVYVRETGSRGPRHWRRGGDVDDHPVVWVNWSDAREYCEWMTKSLRDAGRMTGEFEVRLPTELQWEKAARGPDGRTFPWGEQAPDASYLNFDNNAGELMPVGRFEEGASLYGCLDMAGNVWEWTLSMERSYPYEPADGRESPHVRGRRILRGGAFDSSARSVRCAIRNWNFPEERDGTIGFRVVLVRV